MSLTDTLLEHSSIYRAWQTPFADQKFAPVREHTPMNRVRRVLDVGAGTGRVAKLTAAALGRVIATEETSDDGTEPAGQSGRRRHR